MWDERNAEDRSLCLPPALIGCDEFPLAIPWRVGLHQSPPPLHQPGTACSKLGSPVEDFAANGELSLNCLSHPRGQAQDEYISHEFLIVWRVVAMKAGDGSGEKKIYVTLNGLPL